MQQQNYRIAQQPNYQGYSNASQNNHYNNPNGPNSYSGASNPIPPYGSGNQYANQNNYNKSSPYGSQNAIQSDMFNGYLPTY